MKENLQYLLIGIGIIALGTATYFVLENAEAKMLSQAKGNTMIDAIIAKTKLKKQT